MSFYDRNVLTNFSNKDFKYYKKAIEIYGDDNLYIDNDAFDCNGRKLYDSKALKTFERGNDLSGFWKIFDKIKQGKIPLTLENIKVGMKVVPFKKTIGINYSAWTNDDYSMYKFFKENGFLYVTGLEERKIWLSNVALCNSGDYFDISDFELYIEKPKEKSKSKQETVIYEIQPHYVTYTAETSLDDYNEVFVENVVVDKEEIKIIFNGNTTVCILEDGTKGIAKLNHTDTYDRQIGQDVAMRKARIKQMENMIKNTTASKSK